jgi:hypothetical protein
MVIETVREIEVRLSQLLGRGSKMSDPHRSLFLLFGLLFLKYASDRLRVAAPIDNEQLTHFSPLTIPWDEII